MKATGIVRRIDDLGRVVIPKEIRRTMRIREGDPLEIYTSREGEVIFKKYSLLGGVEDFAAELCETMSRSTGSVCAVTDRDTVIGLTASGRTPYVMGALRRANEEGCHTAAISCNRGAAVSALADTAVEVDTGPEILSGSTRLKAGTAEKMILNMISTASMVGIGKVYQNLMVDVRQTNQKLVCRAQSIVMQAAGCTREEASEALRETGGEAKTAVVKLLLNVDTGTAQTLLENCGGKVRQALAAYRCEKEA